METWLKEGLADYVRYYVLRPWDPKRRFDPKSANWDSGYAASAGLLDWLQRRHEGLIRALDKGLRIQLAGAPLIERATGESLDVSWRRYLADPVAALAFEAG